MQTNHTGSKNFFPFKYDVVYWRMDKKIFKFKDLKEIDLIFVLRVLEAWSSLFFIFSKRTSHTIVIHWESASEFIGGCNTARATRSHCRKAANRRIKHRLTPNPQPQEIRTLDRIAYISAALLSSSSFSRGAEERTRPSFSLSSRSTNTMAFTANPRRSQPPLKLIFACHVFFGSPVWLWEMPAGAASFLSDLADWTHRRTDTIGENPTRRCNGWEKWRGRGERTTERKGGLYANKKLSAERKRRTDRKSRLLLYFVIWSRSIANINSECDLSYLTCNLYNVSELYFHNYYTLIDNYLPFVHQV